MEDIKTIVTHAACADGIASAVIAALAFPFAEVVPVLYGPQRDKLEASEGMLFVDMTPPDARVQEFVVAGAWCLDHHIKQRWITEAFGERGRFSDEPGVSGALLAFEHVLKPRAYQHHRGRFTLTSGDVDRLQDYAILAGIRDTWQKDHPRWKESGIQRETLLFYGLDHWMDILKDPDMTTMATGYEDWLPIPGDTELAVGSRLVEKQRKLIEKVADEVIIRETRGTRYGVVPAQGAITSDLAEYMRERGVPTLFTFWYSSDGTSLTLHISARSDGTVDVGKLATSQGGGGHVRAAGWEYSKLEHTPIDALWHVIQNAHTT